MYIVQLDTRFVLRHFVTDFSLNHWLLPGTDASDPLSCHRVAVAMEACCHDGEA
jgi:hypothetical protein